MIGLHLQRPRFALGPLYTSIICKCLNFFNPAAVQITILNPIYFPATGVLPAFQLRVGNSIQTTGHRGGFEDNPLCRYVRLHDEGTRQQRYTCDGRLQGDVISVQMVDTVSPDPLVLRDISINI